MANIKSAKKRIKVIETKTLVNRKRKSAIKTYIKKFENALDNNNIDEAKELFKKIEKNLDRAANKNTMHKNTASRKVSKLAKRLNNAI
ncbi:30S ribosomal protein S20 [Clostridium sp. D2Q-11]|uniref:Small ribosomal subunit protein bS20 n=1 Tax=Anaeromonas frigoriresistens TaxID=2683708 RepID=A0A942UYM0_9FIRM|nr:30S ribosomal protein S20 [Anaeromonas frigoriresistens]MBS4536867.1 30S ribosomal protein S20 [Anaeromonas frigoriresistens]